MYCILYLLHYSNIKTIILLLVLGTTIVSCSRKVTRVDIDEQIEGCFGIGFGFGLPDIMQSGFGFWLRKLGQAIQDVHGFVLPAALMSRLGVHFVQCCPKPHSSVADS